MKAFGAHLRKARKESGLSAREVSGAINISMTFIYDIEKGTKKPSLETVVKLSQLYKDPSLMNDFMRVNNISDIQIDVSMSADKQRILEELNRQDSSYPIGKTLYKILKSDEAALDEWVNIVNVFIAKYAKRHNGDES